MGLGERPSVAYHNADMLSSIFFGNAVVPEMLILLCHIRSGPGVSGVRFQKGKTIELTPVEDPDRSGSGKHGHQKHGKNGKEIKSSMDRRYSIIHLTCTV